MRIQNSLKNMIYSQIYQFICIALGFVTRIILVNVLGNAALSLNGLFTEVIAVLSLTELGVGSAIIYNLYKPLAENNREKICQLMNLFRTAYRMIALAMTVIGVALIPFVQHLIHNADYDLGYLRLVYFLFLMRTVVSYFYSYKAALLNADQKMYLAARINSIFRIVTVAINIGALLLTQNYIIYLITDIVMVLANNIAVSRIVDRQYPYINEKNMLPAAERKAVLANVKHLFVASLSGKITSSTDNILISLLVGTLQVGLYSNYSLIMTSVKNVIVQMQAAAKGSIGNLVSLESKEKCSGVLRNMTFLSYLVTSICSSALICLSTPVIRLFFGESYVLPDILVFSFVLNFFYYGVREPLWQFIQVSGLFAQDKNIAILGSGVNLAVSIVLGRQWGILGIMIGTTCTMVIQIILKTVLMYRRFFHLSGKPFLVLHTQMLCANTGIMALDMAICHALPTQNPALELIFGGIIAIAVAALINIAVFWRREEFWYSIQLLKDIWNKKGRLG